MSWREQLKKAPRSPGVYVMRDGEKKPLYVGKAKSLDRRVRAYIDAERHSPKNRLMLRRVRSVEFIVTDTEVEALVLENSLIKKWKPRYNISLRDDKTFPFLRLSVQEDFPALTVVRKPARDGARYFGPYVPAGAMRRTLEVLQGIFPLRRCRGSLAGRKRPCLNFQMKKCLGPCTGNVAAREYGELVHGVTLFLQGKGMALAKELRRKMEKLASGEHFEEAALLRDTMQAVEATLARQKAHFAERGDMDAFGTAERGTLTALAVLHLRRGRIVGSVAYSFDKSREEERDSETMAEMVRAFYAPGIDVPPLVLLPGDAEGAATLESWLTGMADGKVSLKVPKRGELRSLVAMASRNALNEIDRKGASVKDSGAVLRRIARKAGWRREVRSLAAIDVSNVSGKDTVASLVWFSAQGFEKKNYRRLKIDPAVSGDDYGAIEEAAARIGRRIQSGKWHNPDILLVDGGMGQLRAARRALGKGGLSPVVLLAIAKPAEVDGTDRIYAAGRRAPLEFVDKSEELLLLQRIRDEAHRFAVTYHRQRRARSFSKSLLDEVPGLGSVRKKLLLRAFGSLKKVREASQTELENTPGLPKNVATAIYKSLHKDP